MIERRVSCLAKNLAIAGALTASFSEGMYQGEAAAGDWLAGLGYYDAASRLSEREVWLPGEGKPFPENK